MSDLTDLEKTLLLIFRHIGMPADEAGTLSLILTECNLEQKMLDWMMENPLSTPQEVLDQLSRMLQKRKV